MKRDAKRGHAPSTKWYKAGVTPALSRSRRLWGRVFQAIGYMSLFIGLVAAVGAVVFAIATLWPREVPPSSRLRLHSDIELGWLIFFLRDVTPRRISTPIIVVLQVAIGLVGLWLLVWGWMWAVRLTRRLVWWVADALLWSVSVVELLLLSLSWAVASVGAWLLVADAIFWPLLICMMGALLVGAICFMAMRAITARGLDLTRADAKW